MTASERRDVDTCCPGEPAFGDPQGLHNFDCPVYHANMDALERLKLPTDRAGVPDPGLTSEAMWDRLAGFVAERQRAPEPDDAGRIAAFMVELQREQQAPIAAWIKIVREGTR